jgi:hypothetical protein
MSDVAILDEEVEPTVNPVEARPLSIARGTAAPLSMLFISPFSPLPQDAGQRKRVHQTLRLLKDLGFSVTLLLYPFEGPWGWRYQSAIADQLHSEYDDVLILPAARTVGASPQHGSHHSLDEWWDDLLASYLLRLCEIRHFDVMLVNNVWLSKALTLAQPCVVKVIDMHDLFHRREISYATSNIVPDFFRINEEDELSGLNRADICISISLPEARYLAGVIQTPKIVYLPYAPQATEIEQPTALNSNREYLHANKVVFGFIGTSHGFNVSGVASLLEELYQNIFQSFAPVEIVLAGTICDALRPAANGIRITKLGWVENEDDFYDRIDFFVVPVFHGSGFKIKVADILMRGKPALFSAHSVDGLTVDEKLVAADAGSMARAMSDIAFSRPPLTEYAGPIEKSSRILNGSVISGTKAFVSSVNQCIVECLFDLRSLTEPRKPIALLSVVAMARELKDFARVRIVVDRVAPWLELASRYLSPAISIESSWPITEMLGSSPTRVWWHFASDVDAPVSSRKAIMDLRFTDQFAADGISGDVVLSPNQAAKLVDVASPKWSCLPYLTDSTRWDPVTRIILGAFEKGPDGDSPADAGSARPDERFIIVDGEHELGGIPDLFGRVGIDVRVVDLRHDLETGRLLAALYRLADRAGAGPRILDGCTGVSPLRYLVLEMAILCGIPISTNAFGPHQEISGAVLQKWRAHKVREDQAAYQTLVRQFDSLRGRLRRLDPLR